MNRKGLKTTANVMSIIGISGVASNIFVKVKTAEVLVALGISGGLGFTALLIYTYLSLTKKKADMKEKEDKK